MNSTSGRTFKLDPDESVVTVQSGDKGDFVVQTSKRLFYGKEGYKSTICEDLNFSTGEGDIVHLSSFNAIYIIRDDHVIPLLLSEYFQRRRTIEQCPIYDILLNSPPYRLLDTKESYTDSAVIRGLSSSPALVSTPIPSQVRLVHSISKWEERVGIQSRRITTDMELISEGSIGRGTRLIPFVTWYYSDATLSCAKPSYNMSLLHYGHCVTTERTTFGPKENIKYAYEGEHAAKQLVVSRYLPEQEGEGGAMTTPTDSDLSSTSVNPTLFASFEAFTNSERKRAMGQCDSAACPLYRNQYYNTVHFSAQVGVPFVPKLEILNDPKTR